MKTYPVKNLTHSLIPFGSRAGLPCIKVTFDRDAEALTAGQVFERAQVLRGAGNISEMLLVGEHGDPLEFIDYDFILALGNNSKDIGYRLNLITNGRHKLGIRVGFLDHVIVCPLHHDLEIETTSDLVVKTGSTLTRDDFDNFNYTHGFILVDDIGEIPHIGASMAAVHYNNWRYCIDISSRFERFQ